MTEQKLDRVVMDTEVYHNYFLCAMKNTRNNRIVTLEMHDGQELDREQLIALLRKYTIVTFNGNHFDMMIIAMALAGRSCSEIKACADDIIRYQLKPWIAERKYGVTIPRLDHIDLIEVAPLTASLKIYNGRLHGKRMQDLPYDPETFLTREQMQEVKDYCINDLAATELLLTACEEPIELREVMGKEYGMDLRSKSDAQVAETVVKAELEKVTGDRVQKPELSHDFKFKYQVPSWMTFDTPVLQELLDKIRAHEFRLAGNGSVIAPEFLKDQPYVVGSAAYALGVGGMHSVEQSVCHLSDDEYQLIDRDVASYYPMIILNQRLFPKHIGEAFLTVYKSLVQRRLVAKKAKQKLIADSLKISINGLFGKLGSIFSAIYSPDQLAQVTISGQLCLLMLIEKIEQAGMQVISGNTDGFITKVPRDRLWVFDRLVHDWETITNFDTEDTLYRAVYSRDVNNYLAVKMDGETKGKGAFANPWKGDKPDYRGQMSLTPASTICVEAVEARIVHGISIEKTVRACRDVRKLVNVRTVKGGGLYGGEYLGKAVRWYYGYSSEGCITSKLSGNKVAGTDGAVPIMDLPDTFPGDVNYDKYISDAREMLIDLGYSPNIDKHHPYQLLFAEIIKQIKSHERKLAKRK